MCIISAYRVVVAEPNGEARVRERVVWNGSSRKRGRAYAFRHTQTTHHSTYLDDGERTFLKCEWDPRTGEVKVLPMNLPLRPWEHKHVRRTRHRDPAGQ